MAHSHYKQYPSTVFGMLLLMPLWPVLFVFLLAQKHARFPVKHAEGALGVRPAVRGRVFILLVDPPSPSFLEMVRKLKLGLN